MPHHNQEPRTVGAESNATPEVVGRSIAAARKTFGMKQAELAERMVEAGHPTWRQTTVSRIENGKQPAREDELASLTEILGADLASGSPQSTPTASPAGTLDKLQIGRNVRAARQAAGLTQSEIAERMTAAGHPWTRPAITRLESGERGADEAELATLEGILGANLKTGTTLDQPTIVKPAGIPPSVEVGMPGVEDADDDLNPEEAARKLVAEHGTVDAALAQTRAAIEHYQSALQTLIETERALRAIAGAVKSSGLIREDSTSVRGLVEDAMRPAARMMDWADKTRTPFQVMLDSLGRSVNTTAMDAFKAATQPFVDTMNDLGKQSPISQAFDELNRLAVLPVRGHGPEGMAARDLWQGPDDQDGEDRQ